MDELEESGADETRLRVYTMSIQRTLLVCTFVCILVVHVNAAWWPFSSSPSEETNKVLNLVT